MYEMLVRHGFRRSGTALNAGLFHTDAHRAETAITEPLAFRPEPSKALTRLQARPPSDSVDERCRSSLSLA